MGEVHGMSTKKITFEEAFQKLEGLVAKLEKGEMDLDKALDAFEEGMTLIRICNDRLDDAELRLSRLTRDEKGGLTVENLE